MDPPAVVDFEASRGWPRAFADLREGLAARRLWQHLAGNDLKQRYRRSRVGPFWLTIATAVTTAGLGALFSFIFHNDPATFVPYVGTGLIVWGFVNGCLSEGMACFTSADELIRQLPTPLTVYVLRTVWRQVLIMGYNMIVYVVMLIVFFPELHKRDYTMTGQACGVTDLACHPGVGWGALLAIPGFLLLVVSGAGMALGLGIVSTRYRDLPQVVASVVQLLFFITPISWPLDTLMQNTHGAAWVIQFNPFFHYVQIVRQPLIGQHLDWWSWLVVLAMTALCWVISLAVLKRYRYRVSYWL
jgi:ABC-2 type transport system permease protein